jgi:cathepsin A (carboxypeptidase C)
MCDPRKWKSRSGHFRQTLLLFVNREWLEEVGGSHQTGFKMTDPASTSQRSTLLTLSIGQAVVSRTRGHTRVLINNDTGGPGCSSTIGLLFELSITNAIHSSANPSTSDTHTLVTVPRLTVVLERERMYVFFQLFFYRSPGYSRALFHVAERYAAAIFHRKNKPLALNPVPRLIKINLASVIIVNGATDPYEQIGSVPDWACEDPYPLCDDPDGPL